LLAHGFFLVCSIFRALREIKKNPRIGAGLLSVEVESVLIFAHWHTAQIFCVE